MVAEALLFESLHQVGLLGLLGVQGEVLHALLVGELGSLVSCSQQVAVGCIVGLRGLPEVEVLVLADLGEFGCALLKFEKVMLGSLDPLIGGGILTLLVAVGSAELIDLLLVAAALLLELLQLEVGTVDVLAQGVRVVGLGLSFALEAENFGLTTANLLPEGSDLNLHVVVLSRLVVQEVASIIGFFLQAVQGDAV